MCFRTVAGLKSDTPLGTKKEALKHCRGIPPLFKRTILRGREALDTANIYLLRKKWAEATALDRLW